VIEQDLKELEDRKRQSELGGGEKRIERQHAEGKLKREHRVVRANGVQRRHQPIHFSSVPQILRRR